MTSATSITNQMPHAPVLKARMSETPGLAANTSSGHFTPLQNSMQKKMPMKTIPVPRSGCSMMSSHGMSTTSAGRQRSTSDVGASRRAASTRASIRTTKILASSDGCPMRTPAIVSHPFWLAAVPAPEPKTRVSARSATPPR